MPCTISKYQLTDQPIWLVNHQLSISAKKIVHPYILLKIYINKILTKGIRRNSTSTCMALIIYQTLPV